MPRTRHQPLDPLRLGDARDVTLTSQQCEAIRQHVAALNVQIAALKSSALGITDDRAALEHLRRATAAVRTLCAKRVGDRDHDNALLTHIVRLLTVTAQGTTKKRHPLDA